MASFKIDEKYSARYSLEKAGSGWAAEGELKTKITFNAKGNTRQAAVNAAQQPVRDSVPE